MKSISTIMTQIEVIRFKLLVFSFRVVTYILQKCMIKRVQKHAVVVKLDRIGDFALCLNFMKQAKVAHGQISLICSEDVAPFAEQTRIFEDITRINVDRYKRSFYYQLEILFKITTKKFDKLYHPTRSREWRVGELISSALDAGQKIAPESNLSNIQEDALKYANKSYNKIWLPGDRLRNSHESIYLNEFTRFCFGGICFADPAKFGNSKRDKYLVLLFVGSSVGLKEWPAEKFADLLLQLNLNECYDIRICGSAADSTKADYIKQWFPRAENYCGLTSVSEICAWISEASLVVSNDSFAVHYAALYFTPCVAIVGGGHFGRFLPYPAEGANHRVSTVYHRMDCYQCNWQCSLQEDRTRPAPCVERVTVEEVAVAINSIINRRLLKNQGKDVDML
jgi:ADP-heptose:LPS heptosyltransferase